jgi:hypothetical protein
VYISTISNPKIYITITIITIQKKNITSFTRKQLPNFSGHLSIANWSIKSLFSFIWLFKKVFKHNKTKLFIMWNQVQTFISFRFIVYVLTYVWMYVCILCLALLLFCSSHHVIFYGLVFLKLHYYENIKIFYFHNNNPHKVILLWLLLTKMC